MIRPHVLVPVKALGLAKSRLNLPPDERRMIARTLAEHTLRTVAGTLGSRFLVVVTADPSVGELAAQSGASVVNDPHGDLNRAVQHGLASITLGKPVLVLVADLPRLESRALAALVEEVGSSKEPCYVPDVHGTGTTAAYLPPGWRLPTRFGQGSASRFRAAGWARVVNAPIETCIDLDTISDLETYGLPATGCR